MDLRPAPPIVEPHRDHFRCVRIGMLRLWIHRKYWSKSIPPKPHDRLTARPLVILTPVQTVPNDIFQMTFSLTLYLFSDGYRLALELFGEDHTTPSVKISTSKGLL